MGKNPPGPSLVFFFFFFFFFFFLPEHHVFLFSNAFLLPGEFSPFFFFRFASTYTGRTPGFRAFFVGLKFSEAATGLE